MNHPRMVLAGGSGFLGQRIAAYLEPRGWAPVILTRSPNPVARFREVGWDGRTLGAWTAEVESSAAVINLTGRSVNCRYTRQNREAILNSRVEATRAIGQAIRNCSNPPQVWMNASTATLYQHTYGPAHDETSTAFEATIDAKDAFSVSVGRAWEQALAEVDLPQTRRVALRISIVFGTVAGGVFQIMRRLSKLGLGGRMGDGRQYVSWIHKEDFCRAIEWILNHPAVDGPVNLAAPNPLTNAEMMAAFRHVCGIPISVPAAKWMLEVGAFFMRTETELLLKSRRVVPGKLVASGFRFNFPDFEPAIRDLEQRVRAQSR